MNAEFQQRIKPAIDAVASEKGIDILLTSQVALTMNQAYDISKEIIAKADEAAKTPRRRPGRRRPAAKPADGRARCRPSRPAAPKGSYGCWSCLRCWQLATSLI
jgi:hypothetical protein